VFTKPSTNSETNSPPGSLGHQFLGVLKAVFQPGRSRHVDKKNGKAHLHIYSKNTMRKYTEEAFEFARFLKASFRPAARLKCSPLRCAPLSLLTLSNVV